MNHSEQGGSRGSHGLKREAERDRCAGELEVLETTRVRDRLGGEGVCRGLGKMGRNTSKASGGERSLKELHSCVAVCRVLVIGF